MTIQNFKKPGQSPVVMGQDTLSSGSGTVRQAWNPTQSYPQGSKPAQAPGWPAARGLPNVQGSAQARARDTLPPTNNGNPRGANNMPRLNWWEQPPQNEAEGFQDFYRNQLSHAPLPQYAIDALLGVGRGYSPGNSPAPGRLPPPDNGNPGDANNKPHRNWWEQPQANIDLMNRPINRDALDPEALRQFEASGGFLPQFGRPRRPSEEQVGWYQDETGTGYRYNDPSQSNQQQQNIPSYDDWRANQETTMDFRGIEGERQREEQMRRMYDEEYGQGQGYRPGNSQYYGGQSPGTGRYRPPTMDGRGNWNDYGGYNYNLPNAFGSYPGYGQGNPWSQRMGPGYGSMFDFMPQFLPYGLGPGGGW